MNKTLLILKNEFFSRIKTRSFLISTLVGPFIIAFIIIFAAYLSDNDERHENVLVVDKTEGLFKKAFKNTSKLSFFYDTVDMPDEIFMESPYTLLLYINEGVVETNKVQLFYKKAPSINQQATIKAQFDRALEDFKVKIHKLDRSTYDKVKSSVDMRMFDIKKGGEEELYKYELALVGFFFAYAILLFIISYAGMVMRGVTREKSNRVVEILLTTIKPFKLMLGKILGIGLIGLTQIVLWIVLSVALIFVLKSFFFTDIFNPENIAAGETFAKVGGKDSVILNPASQNAVVEFLSRINLSILIPIFLFYFTFGYLLYGAIFAALGAANDPDADSQLFSLPAFAPLILGIFLAQHAITNPDSALTFWFSIFPLTSPILMIVRVSVGLHVSDIWQLILSMLILIGTFIFVVKLAGKIYQKGILVYGKTVSYRQLFKWIKG
jgi:ABC-2 type transport system permease protein